MAPGMDRANDGAMDGLGGEMIFSNFILPTRAFCICRPGFLCKSYNFWQQEGKEDLNFFFLTNLFLDFCV